MSDFPASVKNFLALQDGVDSVIAAHPNDRGDEITAIETLFGPMGNAQSHSESLKNLLLDYRKGCKLVPDTVAQVTVQVGEIAIPNSSGDVKWRRNTSPVTVTWADIDTGAETSSKRYYVHAVADTAGTTFTVVISLSPTAPSGVTYFHLLGSFFNNSSSNIEDVMDNLWLTGTEPGKIEVWATDTPPGGAILCDGSATVGTTTDPTLTDLFTVIANVFGGSDATDFKVPDLRGRTIIGTDDMGQGSANRVVDAAADIIGGTMGAETHLLTATESGIAQHTHEDCNFGGSGSIGSAGGGAGWEGDSDGVVGGPQSAASAHTSMQPTMALNIIIWK